MHAIGSIYTQLKRDFGYTDAQLGFLFSVYSLPNTFIVFFAGITVDAIGLNKSCLICICFFTAGYLTTLGESYYYLLVGRALYGLGAGCSTGTLPFT